MTETKNCLHCGATMYRRYFDAGQKWANRKACSRECGYKVRGREAAEQVKGRASRDSETLLAYFVSRGRAKPGDDLQEIIAKKVPPTLREWKML